MALRQQVDHPLQVPSKANDDLATSPKADPLILLQSAFYNLYVACSSFLRALVWRTPSSSTLTGKGSDCRIAVNIVRVTITLGISSGQGVSWERTYSVLSLNIYEHSENILSILLSGDQIPHPFLGFSVSCFSLSYCVIYFVECILFMVG